MQYLCVRLCEIHSLLVNDVNYRCIFCIFWLGWHIKTCMPERASKQASRGVRHISAFGWYIARVLSAKLSYS